MGTQALILHEAKNEGISLPQIQSGKLPETGLVPKRSKMDMVTGFFIIIFILFILKRFPSLRSLLITMFLYNLTSSGYRSQTYGSFGGGLGGFGSSSGGFGGGFGGGMSGGGGASGSW